MEFLLFLSSRDKEILELINRARFSVEENTPLCLMGKKYFGFLKKRQRRVVICTKNAMDAGGYLTYLAPSIVNLNLAVERWPEIIFNATREH